MPSTVSLKVVLDDKGVLESLQSIDAVAGRIAKESPIKIKIDAAGLQNVSKEIVALAKAQTRLAVEQEKTRQAHEKSVQAIQKTIQANEKSTQAMEKTAQAQAKLATAQERTIQTQERTSQALERTYQSEERTAQALERTRQATERTTQAKERTVQATERTRQAELKLQTEQEKTNRSMQGGASAANAFSVALGTIAARAFHMVINKITQAFREALSTMKEVDSELANIQKVTDETDAVIEKVGDTAYETASKYGISASEYLAAAGDFAKAGYDNYTTMAELATKTQLVGDVNAEIASKFLLSADAAWKFQGNVEDLSSVLDKANVIENNYATSIEKMASGFPLVASTAAMAGMSVDETLAALGTITAKTQESGTMAARALRALILNILKDTETEIEDGVTWTEAELDSLNDLLWKYAGEAMQTAQKNGGVVNPMEAIKALHDAYEEGLLTQKELTDLAMDLGGKLRTNQLLALITNFDTFNEMLGKTAESAGSADKEIDVMLGTWEAKTNILKNTWTDFVSDLVDTDTIKNAVDMLTGIVDSMDKLVQSKSEALRETDDALQSYIAEMEALEGKGDGLTYWEEQRLAYLKEQTAELEKQKQAKAKESLASAWYQYDAFKDTVIGPEEIYGNFLGDISTAQNRVVENSDFEGYRAKLKGIADAYGEIYQATIDARDAGISLSSTQEQFISAYEGLTTAASASDKEINQAISGLKINQDLYAYYKKDLDTIRQKNEEAASTAAGISYDSATGSAGKLLEILQAIAAIGGDSAFAFGAGMATGGVSGGGRTLVNELGPELISDRGRAFIANGGRPGVVNLSRGAIVIPAGQTRSILRSGGMPSRSAAVGLNTGMNLTVSPSTSLSPNVGGMPNTSNTEAAAKELAALVLLGDENPTAHQYWNAGRGQRGYGAVFYDPEGLYAGTGKTTAGNNNSANWSGTGGDYKDVAALAKDLSSLLTNLDKQATLAGNEQNWARQAEIYEQAQEAIKQMVEDYRESGYADDSDEILDLLNKNYDYANKQLTLYQTKWDELINALSADASATEAANKLAEKQQAVDDAREALANAQRQRTVRIFNSATGQWEWVADQSQVASAQKSLTSAEQNYTDTVKSEAIAELKRLKESAADLTDVVLGPALSTVAQMAESTMEFQNFARALDAVYGVGTFLNSTEGTTKALSTVDSHDTVYSFNGLKLTDAQAQNMTVAELAKSLSILNLTV